MLPVAYRGEGDRALELAEQARTLSQPTGSLTLQALTDYAVAEVVLDTDPQGALAAANAALAAARQARSGFVIGIALVSAASLHGRHGDPYEVIGHWHRSGNRAQQWSTLRNTVDLLTRLAVDEPAAMLYGALAERQTGAPAFGADAQRLAAAAGTLRTRLGEQRYASALARGAAMSDEDAVAFASAAIARCRSEPPPTAR